MTFDAENHQAKPKRKKWPWVAGGAVAVVAVIAVVSSSGGGESGDTENAAPAPPPTAPEKVAPPVEPKQQAEPAPPPAEEEGKHVVEFEATVGQRANVDYGHGFDTTSLVYDAGETVSETVKVDDLSYLTLSVLPVNADVFGPTSTCKITVDGKVVTEQENPLGVWCTASQN